MTEQPAGWYPDPFGAAPGAQRYWDGERWTPHAQAPLLEAPPENGAPPVSSGDSHPQQPGYQRHPGHPEGLPYTRPNHSGELASWGIRFAAYLLDLVPTVVLTLVMIGATGIWGAVLAAIESRDAAAIDAANAMMSASHPAGLTITIVNVLFVAVYNIGFHMRSGQTLGKKIMGIRVRMADNDRNPTLRAAGLRFLTQFGPSQLSGLPVLGFAGFVFVIADHLWPLWDRSRQALHDKVGRTVVVRTR